MNITVQWSGLSLYEFVSYIVPLKVVEMVYSRLGTIPEIDEDYFYAIQEAGQIYKRI